MFFDCKFNVIRVTVSSFFDNLSFPRWWNGNLILYPKHIWESIIVFFMIMTHILQMSYILFLKLYYFATTKYVNDENRDFLWSWNWIPIPETRILWLESRIMLKPNYINKINIIGLPVSNLAMQLCARTWNDSPACILYICIYNNTHYST